MTFLTKVCKKFELSLKTSGLGARIVPHVRWVDSAPGQAGAGAVVRCGSHIPILSHIPIQRAFGVPFTADTARGDAGMAGRVEPIVSGQAMRFHSREELLTFITQILQTLPAPEDP